MEELKRVAMGGERPEYDDLDEFVNEWLSAGEMPEPTIGLPPGMVEFYKTPARVVVELAGTVEWTDSDVFIDLGCGLGQVVLLVHLLTGVEARGVEIEPAYCAYAQSCKERLDLAEGVSFVSGDMRDVDLSEGTIFFLFTPVKGAVFERVMGRLKGVAAMKRILVIGYGPCSKDLANVDWLRREYDSAVGEYKLHFFGSVFSNA